jgi:ubiquinol-cytochrome c reductase cytochrome c1 subunit
MFKKSILSALMALGLATAGHAAEHGEHNVEDIAFSFEGVFGTYDQAQLQRGLQVYTEVCSNCHGLSLVAYRTLGDEGGVGLPEDQVKAYAAQHEAYDPELGDYRTAIPSDKFGKSQYDGAPDLSLMAKARKGFEGPYGLLINPLFRGVGGPEYIVAILNGYTGKEKDLAGSTVYENTAFPGGWIRMPPPLSDGLVEFDPAAPNDQKSLSKDVAAFLMWAAEPKLVQRHKAGVVAVIFLIFLAVMLYLTNKKLWAKAKHKD